MTPVDWERSSKVAKATKNTVKRFFVLAGELLNEKELTAMVLDWGGERVAEVQVLQKFAPKIKNGVVVIPEVK